MILGAFDTDTNVARSLGEGKHPLVCTELINRQRTGVGEDRHK